MTSRGSESRTPPTTTEECNVLSSLGLRQPSFLSSSTRRSTEYSVQPSSTAATAETGRTRSTDDRRILAECSATDRLYRPTSVAVLCYGNRPSERNAARTSWNERTVACCYHGIRSGLKLGLALQPARFKISLWQHFVLTRSKPYFPVAMCWALSQRFAMLEARATSTELIFRTTLDHVMYKN